MWVERTPRCRTVCDCTKVAVVLDVAGFSPSSSSCRVTAVSRRTADVLFFCKMSFCRDGRVQEFLAGDASSNQGLQKDCFQS